MDIEKLKETFNEKKKLFLQTKNLLVFRPDVTDLDELTQLLADEDVMRYVSGGPRAKTIVREQLEKLIQHDLKHEFSIGSVYEKETFEFVGRAGLIYLAMDDTQNDIEIGYALQKKFWNKGYATELARALVKWGFSHLQTKYLVAVINPENDRSRRVLEKTGMRYVGRDFCYNTDVAKYIIHKPEIDYQTVKLIPATIADYPIMQNMARFYAYDISQFYGHESGWEMHESGLYETGLDFKQYFEEERTFPFLIRYHKTLAGFVIVDQQGSDTSVDFNMAQFFILKTYKAKGIGKYVANKCFDQFHGTWEIMVMPENGNAYRFWRKVVKDYTHNNFVEYTKKVAAFNNEKRNFFKFIA